MAQFTPVQTRSRQMQALSARSPTPLPQQAYASTFGRTGTPLATRSQTPMPVPTALARPVATMPGRAVQHGAVQGLGLCAARFQPDLRHSPQPVATSAQQMTFQPQARPCVQSQSRPCVGQLPRQGYPVNSASGQARYVISPGMSAQPRPVVSAAASKPGVYGCAQAGSLMQQASPLGARVYRDARADLLTRTMPPQKTASSIASRDHPQPLATTSSWRPPVAPADEESRKNQQAQSVQVSSTVEPGADVGLADSAAGGHQLVGLGAAACESSAGAVAFAQEAPGDSVQPLSWDINDDSHPMEVAGEREFIQDCLRQLAAMLRQHGGVLGYRDSRKELTDQELDRGPIETLRRALEAILQTQARTSGDCIFVQNGWVISMGGKKVVKLFVNESEECEGKLSVCWSWDVKLEPRQ
eukprot:TRINITY_DN13282_c0_g1_i1.p1 TRINITY_DN13282_c0_g1~~TRINITY_DN13282_c0_g1_i1.p1  ORF type:complete len:414 (+),score=57.98 TRINITY_DN13282_c0_g1_i1:97-1338(+)